MNKKVNLKSIWNVLKAHRKVILVAIGIFLAAIVSVKLYGLYDDNYGRTAHLWDSELGENICIHRFHNGTVRVYDLGKEKYISPRLRWVACAPRRDSLTVFCGKDGKRGFLNKNTGEVVLGGRYEHAWIFSEGLAAVVEPGGKMGFINGTGEYVIEPELDYMPSHDYVFKHGVCCIEDRDGNQGLLGRDGKWVLPQEYSYIDYISEADMFIVTKDSKDGLMRNGSFEWVYPLEYDDIAWADAMTGEGLILYKDFRSRHVSLDGSVLDAFLVDETYELKYMTKYNADTYDEYTISDKVMAFRVYDLWGVMDKHTGEVLVPAMYCRVGMASKDVLECTLDIYISSNCVLYDLKGNRIE